MKDNAIKVFLILIAVITIAFNFKNSPIIWLLFSIITVFLFFTYLSLFNFKWNNIPEQLFKRVLFSYAFSIRLTFILFLYLLFQIKTGQPFEFYAADSLMYHRLGIEISSGLIDGRFEAFDKMRFLGYSDRGYPFILSVLYVIGFQTIIFPRIIHAILGAWTCVLIYKLAKRNFGEIAGRIAGIMAMLLPNLIYYTGLHLKETIMVFLLVALFERADYLLRSRQFQIKTILIIALLNVSLFSFRTVLGTAALISIVGAFIFSSGQFMGWSKRMILIFWIGLIVYFFLFERVNNEISQYWMQRGTNQASQMRHFSTREGANELAEYGNTALFAPLMLFAPFPTLVNIKGQENHMMLAGAYYTRNVYAFFVIIALLVLIKQKIWRNHLLIIIFILSYLAILAKSGFALSERFHLPAVPFLLILAAYGITQMNYKNARYYVPYLIVMALVIIGWNWFKLAGRGLI